MPASVNDKFRIASGSTRPVVATLALPKAAGATTAELQVATGWNTTTGLDYVMYRRQLNTTTGKYEEVAGTRIEGRATLSGTTLSAMTIDAGTEPASGYAADGNTVVLSAATAQWADDLINGILGFANQDGTLKTAAVQAALGISGSAGDGWSILNAGIPPTATSGQNKGNKEVDLLYSNVNLSTVVSPGMRYKVDRTGATPTQCADLETSSSQSASRASGSVVGMSFTDDFTIEAWINLESYTPGVTQRIVGRLNSGVTAGFVFGINPAGDTLELFTVGTGNRTINSCRAVPLGQWVHVAVTMDMSGSAGNVYINGVADWAVITGAGTALAQGGDLMIGNFTGSTGYFDGKIADVRIWSTIRTATQIRDNMNQQLVGNEAGLVSYFKLDGNFNDSTANANNLTAGGGAVATTVDNPFKTTEYALIHKVTYSAPNTIVTVFTGTDSNIPNMVLQNPYYSTQKTPFGFNPDESKWSNDVILGTSGTPGITGTAWVTSVATGVLQVQVGSGAWDLEGILAVNFTGIDMYVALSTLNNAPSNQELVTRHYLNTSSARLIDLNVKKKITQSTPTIWYALMQPSNSTGSSFRGRQSDPNAFAKIRVKSAYL